ncbi:MAG: methionine adenosyltransferase [Methylomonas sp.]|nr:methionine adenosyltransferase [Methylomonas sp.]PPD22885.1 MAG: methionine adenosyltransferase [Methylomonas sp.]PPD27394.1 MAG: methionine adenosyltransferase [Methylomonas sp.]PPD39370.1 MAG: methionine adenosyltransferase [Methylomonas sp.]PPD41862.1 MAG: methionine adenosyltransferase [Methylomonas sp.]
MITDFVFNSQSVTSGHPDRMCDIVSDAIIDAFLRQDKNSRITAECALSRNILFLAARYASDAVVDIPETARKVIAEIGYRPEDFDAAECTVVTSLIEQQKTVRETDFHALDSAEIDRITVSHQCSVFGFACNHTADLMPLPITLANALARQLQRVWDTLDYISPDCTTQVGVEFIDGRPQRIHGLTLIVGCDDPKQTPTPARMADDIRHHVIAPVFENASLQPDRLTRIVINPNGPFVRSGPTAHSGMTGRKTDSDTYGSFARHSGSALSGKSPSRIDRIGVYAARHAAKNIVAAGLAEQCEVQLSYSIGHAGPVSVLLNTNGTGKLDDHAIRQRLLRHFDFRLGAIVRDFDLRQLPARHKGVFYQRLPAIGHFGEHDLALPWEKTDKAALLAD